MKIKINRSLFFSGGKEKNNSRWKGNREEIVHCGSEIFEDEKRQNNQTNQIESVVVENGKGCRFEIGHFIRST